MKIEKATVEDAAALLGRWCTPERTALFVARPAGE